MERDAIVTELLDTMQAMKRVMHSHMQTAQEGFPVSHGQLEVIFTIKHLQPISFTKLARKLMLTTGAVSQVVDGLIGEGFVEQETDPADRRIKCLRLSAKGDLLFRKIEKHRRDSMEKVMHSLTTDELKTWLHIQEKIIEEFQTK